MGKYISCLLIICLMLATARSIRAADPGAETEPLADGEFVIKQPYANAPEMTVRPDIPKGTLHRFTMKSGESKIYPGMARATPGEVDSYERKVVVYVPADYQAGTPAPFMVVQDGTSNTNLNTLPPVLDNMIHDKRLPAMVAVMINNGGGDGQGSERGLEYDTVSDKYTLFIEKEVLPKISKDYHITFTQDPEGRATMGGSSGAACAFTMGWFHPELYRRILSYSGTFVNQQSPKDPATPRGAWEYHAKLIPAADAKPLRVWLEVGEKDNGYTRDEETLHNWVLANQRMAAALKAKGYHYRYVFAEGAGHNDKRVIAQTLPGALLWVWQGYPIK